MYKHTNNKNKKIWPNEEVKPSFTLFITSPWILVLNTNLNGSIEKAIMQNNTEVNRADWPFTTAHTGLSGAKTFFTWAD